MLFDAIKLPSPPLFIVHKNKQQEKTTIAAQPQSLTIVSTTQIKNFKRGKQRNNISFLCSLRHLTDLAQTLERTQAEREALRSAAYPHETGDGAVVAFLLHAQIGEGVLTCEFVSNCLITPVLT